MAQHVGRRGRGSAADRRARQEAIQQYVTDNGGRTVEEIAQHTGVSTMTIYRDLSQLEASDLLRLERGVVTAAPSNLHESSWRYRLNRENTEKAQLAQVAVTLIEPGSAIMLDDSTTGLHLARLLPAVAPLTVVTNSQAISHELQDEPRIRLLVTGGEYHLWADALMGPMTVHTLCTMQADAVFMSASAVSGSRCFHPAEQPAEVKRTMLRCSARRILYVDHTKFERTALHLVAPLSDFDVVIVDDATPPHYLDGLPPRVQVIRAPVTR